MLPFLRAQNFSKSVLSVCVCVIAFCVPLPPPHFHGNNYLVPVHSSRESNIWPTPFLSRTTDKGAACLSPRYSRAIHAFESKSKSNVLSYRQAHKILRIEGFFIGVPCCGFLKMAFFKTIKLHIMCRYFTLFEFKAPPILTL